MTTTQNVSIIKEESDKIVTLCEQPNTALKAIHKIIAMNGAGELAWLVVNNRTLADKDIKSAM